MCCLQSHNFFCNLLSGMLFCKTQQAGWVWTQSGELSTPQPHWTESLLMSMTINTQLSSLPQITVSCCQSWCLKLALHICVFISVFWEYSTYAGSVWSFKLCRIIAANMEKQKHAGINWKRWYKWLTLSVDFTWLQWNYRLMVTKGCPKWHCVCWTIW